MIIDWIKNNTIKWNTKYTKHKQIERINVNYGAVVSTHFFLLVPKGNSSVFLFMDDRETVLKNVIRNKYI